MKKLNWTYDNVMDEALLMMKDQFDVYAMSGDMNRTILTIKTVAEFAERALRGSMLRGRLVGAQGGEILKTSSASMKKLSDAFSAIPSPKF